MADPQQILDAIRKADAAGDTAGAARLAQIYKQTTAAPAETPPASLGDQIHQGLDNAAQATGDWFQKNGRGIATTAGGILGGVIAAPEAVAAGLPTFGVGGVATEAGGVGLGAGIGGQAYDLANRLLTRSKPQALADQLKTVATDVGTNAVMVPAGAVAGRVLGAAVSKAPQVAAAIATTPQAIGNVLDAGSTQAAQNVRQAALAKVLSQQQATAKAAAMATALKANDVPLRATMEGVAQQQAAQGIGVSDVPQAQALVADLKSRLNPQGQVVTVPTADQTKAYQSIINTLSPTSAGQKPSLEMVANLRRQLADAAYGGSDPSGFAAVGKIDRQALVKQLNDIEDAYTSGASAPVRENWRAATVAQEQADEAEKLKNSLAAQAIQMDELPADKAVSRAQTIVTSLKTKGLISDPDYRDFLQLANAASTAQGKAAFRKKLALYVTAGAVGAEAAHVGGNVLGAIK